MNQIRTLRRVAALLLMVAACRAAVAPPAEHAELPSPAALDAGAMAASPVADAGDPTLSPSYEAKIDEIERVHDWRSTVYGSRIANPADPLRARTIQKTGTFAYAKTATIRAYRFSKARLAREAEQEEMPFARDGSLDGHIIPPEVTLDDRERDDVLDALRALEARLRGPGPRLAALRCGFDAHHAFVFFDAKGVPIAKLIVCFTCGELMPIPATKQFGGRYPAAMPEELSPLLADIADRHGLGAWMYRDDEALQSYSTRRYGTTKNPTELGRARLERNHAKPSGVSPDANARQADASDRERFCVWLRAEIASRNAESEYGRITGGGWECPDGGPHWAFHTEPPLDNCEQRPMCNAPFSKMESCLRSAFLRTDAPEVICREGKASEACSGVLDCLPFLDRRTLR